MEKINQILKKFSFTDAESELYVAALKLKKAGISDIAKKAGMGRTVAYFHINNMVKRGVLRQVRKGKKIIISPIAPSELAQSLQGDIAGFKTMIPKLEALSKIESEIPEIEIQESKIGFQKIYDEIVHMPVDSIFKVIEDKHGAEAELKMLDNEHWNYFFSQIAEKRIITKAIFTDELLLDVKKSITPKNYDILKRRMWDIRTLPESALPIKNLLVLYNKKISFLFPEISLTITIKHAALFKLFDVLFETVFSFSKKIERPWD